MRRILSALLGVLLFMLPRAVRQEFGRDILADADRRIRETRGGVQRTVLAGAIVADVIRVAVEEFSLRCARGPRSLWVSVSRDLKEAACAARGARIRAAVSVLLLGVSAGATGTTLAVVANAHRGGLPGSEGVRTLRAAPGLVGTGRLFGELERSVPSIDAIAGAQPGFGVLSLQQGRWPRHGVIASAVTPGYLDLLGGEWVRKSSGNVHHGVQIILSEQFWRAELKGAPGVVGTPATLHLSGVPDTAVIGGVFRDVQGYAGSIAAWIVRDAGASDAYREVLVRFAPGVGVTQGRALLREAASSVGAQYRGLIAAEFLEGAVLRPAWQPQDTRRRAALYAIAVLACATLVVAGGSVRLLLLPRAVPTHGSQSREGAARSAEGQGSGTSGVALGLAATVVPLGSLIAVGLETWVRGAGDPALERALVESSLPSLAAAAAIAIPLVLFASRPASPRVHWSERWRSRSCLIASGAVTTLAVAISIGVGGARLDQRTTPTGVADDGLFAQRVHLDASDRSGAALLSRLRSDARFDAAGLIHALPYSGEVWTVPFGTGELRVGTIDARIRIGTPDAPSLLGLELLAGRLVAAAEDYSVVISARVAERLGGPAAAVGQSLTVEGLPNLTIRGVVSDVAGAYEEHRQIGDVYLQRHALPTPWTWVVVRGDSTAASALQQVVSVSAGLVPFGSTTSLSDLFARTASAYEGLYRLAGVLAVIALGAGFAVTFKLTSGIPTGAAPPVRGMGVAPAAPERPARVSLGAPLFALTIGSSAGLLVMLVLEAGQALSAISTSLLDRRVIAGTLLLGFVVPALSTLLLHRRRPPLRSFAGELPADADHRS